VDRKSWGDEDLESGVCEGDERTSVEQHKTPSKQCQHYFFKMNGLSVRVTEKDKKTSPNVVLGPFSPEKFLPCS